MSRLTHAIVVGLVVVGAACAPRSGLVRLPSGVGTPAPDALEHFAAATARCGGVAELSAEIGLSGRLAGTRVRGRLLVGIAQPDRLRLEVVAPFGAPLVVLTARDDEATLVLPRDARIVAGVAPGDLLDALTGLSLTPEDLLAVLTGCVAAERTPSDPRAFGEGWRRVELPGGEAWLAVEPAGARLVAWRHGDYRVEYAGWLSGLPRRARITAARTGGEAVDLALDIRDIDLAPRLDARAFDPTAPAGLVPMSIDELRRARLFGR